MNNIRRSGRRVALLACYPLRDPAMPPQFISNHGMRMVEASLRASNLDGLELQVWDLSEKNLEPLIEELLLFDPDVIGFSTYLWSFPFFTSVAEKMKQDDPGRLIVFGGPSARPSMLSLEAHRGSAQWIDVLVINEGEVTFNNIIAMIDRSESSLANQIGIALHNGDGWKETPPQSLSDLNDLPSPYQMNLVPHGGIGVLQTYRGCPFTCSFCEWGELKSSKRVCDVDTLSAELNALAKNDVTGTLLVDAGLNLNPNAFRNFVQAAEETGFYNDRYLISELYPARVKQDHIDFLSKIGRPLVGVGLQSFDNEVLSHVERSYDEKRFEQTLQKLDEVATLAIEIIMGLPGDTAESFLKSFHRARSLPYSLRVYHCVVLPSALMVKSPASHKLVYDQWNLKMQSCLGWSAEDLQKTVEFVSERAENEGGQIGDFFWVFPPAN
jgi:radical SAM superfamily enzyme YgiQ (UPF0313 family)